MFPWLPIAMGVGGLASAVSNWFSTKDTNESNVQLSDAANKTNLQIAREANKANLDLYREQFGDSYRMWMEQNRYNTPANQVSRLREAGLNPSLAFGSGQAGNASAMSMPSAHPAVSGAPQVAAHLQAPQFNFSDIASSVASMASSQKDLSESSNIEQDVQLKKAMQKTNIQRGLIELEVLRNNARKGSMERTLLDSQIRMAKLQYRLFDESYQSQRESFDLANMYTKQQINVLNEQAKNFAADSALKDANLALSKLNLSYQPALLAASIKDTMSQIALRSAQREVSTKEASLIFNQSVGQYLHNLGESQRQIIERKTFPFVLQSAKNANLLESEQLYNSRVSRLGNISDMLLKPLDMMIDSGKSLGMFYLGGKALGRGAKPLNGSYVDFKTKGWQNIKSGNYPFIKK